MNRRELEAKIIAKAWRDPDYKARLMADPKAVLAKELQAVDPDITLSDALKVNVHEEDANTFHLVLPRDPREVKLGDVMPDATLEAVAPQTIAVVTNAVSGPSANVATLANVVSGISPVNAVITGVSPANTVVVSLVTTVSAVNVAATVNTI